MGTNFSEIWIGILSFSFKKMRLEVSSMKWRPFCPGEHELGYPVRFRPECMTTCISLLWHRQWITDVWSNLSNESVSFILNKLHCFSSTRPFSEPTSHERLTLEITSLNIGFVTWTSKHRFDCKDTMFRQMFSGINVFGKYSKSCRGGTKQNGESYRNSSNANLPVLLSIPEYFYHKCNIHPWWNVMRWFWLSSCLCLRRCEMNITALVPVTYISVTVVTNCLLLCTVTQFHTPI